MSNLRKIEITQQGGHINIQMTREYARQFGGGTYRKHSDLYVGYSYPDTYILQCIFENTKHLADSFPAYNPNPEVLDPGHKANLETIERVNTDYDLYP